MGKLWGTFGPIAFQFLTSPEYGSVRLVKRAKYTEHARIVSRVGGVLEGQKPLREIDGLELDTMSFSCKISAIVLKGLKVNVLEKVALAAGAGPYVGSALGEPEDDERLYTDVQGFIDQLNDLHDNQTPAPFFKGTLFQGVYTIDGLTVQSKDRKNGEIFSAVIDIELTEWISK
jgi:hypothetical protein